jgi:hypothetical protein
MSSALLARSAASQPGPIVVVAVEGRCHDRRPLSRPRSSNKLWSTIDAASRASNETRLVPLFAVARLPVFATHVAELVVAGASIVVSHSHQVPRPRLYLRDVVAAVGAINKGSASAASLPAAVLGKAQSLLQSCVCGTVPVVRG